MIDGKHFGYLGIHVERLIIARRGTLSIAAVTPVMSQGSHLVCLRLDWWFKIAIQTKQKPMRPRESKILAFMRNGPDILPSRHLLGFRSTAQLSDKCDRIVWIVCAAFEKRLRERGGRRRERQHGRVTQRDREG